MKHVLISATISLVLLNGAFAQKLKESDVPNAVREAFAKQFPSIKNVKWSKESESEFEAEFKSSQGEQSANFDMSGKGLVTETDVPQKSLPAAVPATIKKDFAGYKIEESEKAETANHGTYFEIEL